MTRVPAKSFHFFRKFFLMALLAVAGGFGWALWETGTPLSKVLDVAAHLLNGGAPTTTESPLPTSEPANPPKPSPKPSAKPSPRPIPSGAAVPAQVTAFFAEIE